MQQQKVLSTGYPLPFSYYFISLFVAMDTDSHIASKSTEAERASAGIEEYTLLFGNNGWYILFRLHQASGIENKLCLSVCLSVCL
jgi:hypothetical protein